MDYFLKPKKSTLIFKIKDKAYISLLRKESIAVVCLQLQNA